jgi:hypothetical protein
MVKLLPNEEVWKVGEHILMTVSNGAIKLIKVKVKSWVCVPDSETM